jgi:hypothetical protein
MGDNFRQLWHRLRRYDPAADDPARPPMERIKARWTAEGIKLRPGASTEALDRFEDRHQVALPPAFRAYFEAVDGTGDYTEDASIRFWPLAEVETIAGYQVRESGEVPEFDRWFIFADFLINSHVYAVHLSPDPAAVGPVASWDGDLILQAPSFTAFLDRYLTDRDNLSLHMPPAEGRSTARDDGTASA